MKRARDRINLGEAGHWPENYSDLSVNGLLSKTAPCQIRSTAICNGQHDAVLLDRNSSDRSLQASVNCTCATPMHAEVRLNTSFVLFKRHRVLISLAKTFRCVLVDLVSCIMKMDLRFFPNTVWLSQVYRRSCCIGLQKSQLPRVAGRTKPRKPV